jgi:23S rRNA pseudouridine2605 synthase
MSEERLQKILARAGLGSRRKCEELIAEGRVTVNGQLVCEPGVKADPDSDDVRVDGQALASEAPVYFMLNKPAGCLTTAGIDPDARDTVMRYVAHISERVFPVGRLDYDTEGLLLFTNDGAFAQKVIHPSHETVKTYEAVVRGHPSPPAMDMLRRGVILDDGPTHPAAARIIGERTVSAPARRRTGPPVEELVKGAIVELQVHEGRKRMVKRMLRKVGHPVLALRRSAIGRLRIGNLPLGEIRALDEHELSRIFENPD